MYQWWFRLSDSECEGHPTRAWGFLAYVGIKNRGYRSVAVESWRLRVSSRRHGQIELRSYSIPEPQFQTASLMKVFPVLGTTGLFHEGGTMVEAGGGIGGMAFYVYECSGDESWNPRMKGGRISGRFFVRDAFGGRAASDSSRVGKTLG